MDLPCRFVVIELNNACCFVDATFATRIASLLGHAAELSAMIREAGVHLAAGELDGQWIFVNTYPVEMGAMNELVSSLSSVQESTRSNRIVLEINEKAATDEGRMRGLRSSLSKLGIALAYDDFGVGYTSLVELAKSPPDFLKFDISLTPDSSSAKTPASNGPHICEGGSESGDRYRCRGDRVFRGT
jgi:EAL domain-containing protein (putative c-di-GMP-specific phosphodiesterase class I)